MKIKLSKLQEYGFPQVIQHDRGTEFAGHCKKYFKLNKIHDVRSRPYHPQSQGKVENSHYMLKSKMAYDLIKMGEKGVSWVKKLKKYQHIMNQTPRECLGWINAFDVFFGRRWKKLHSTVTDKPINEQDIDPLDERINHVDNMKEKVRQYLKVVISSAQKETYLDKTYL